MAQYLQMSGTGQVKVGAGRLFGVLISSTSSGTITIYDTHDGDTSNDPKILDTFTPTAGQIISFGPGVIFSRGLYCVEGSTLVWTVIYE